MGGKNTMAKMHEDDIMDIEMMEDENMNPQ